MGKGKEHATAGPTLGQTRRGVILFSLGLGWSWVGLMLVAPIFLRWFMSVALFGNGLVAAAYLIPLYWIRGETWSTTTKIIVLLVSLTHVGWVAAYGAVLFLLDWTPSMANVPLILPITGLGFGITLGIASRSVVPLLVVAVAGLVAGPVSTVFPSLDVYTNLGAGFAVLHAAMVSMVAFETWHRPALPVWPDTNTCLRCGYSLVGLPEGAVCPECGDQTSRDE